MPLHPGLRLGPYELIAPLGAGGMGEVFKARDTRLDRTVAIKVLAPHAVDDPSTRTRFEREARAISSLDHPNICTIYDVGRDGDVDYIVMQYFEGETLAARIARGPLPLDDALRYATEIASALDRAHRAGILHRDLKPGNVMLAKSAGHGTSAHLLDFGLAKILPTGPVHGTGTVAATVTTPLTGSGTILGTLLYMSPEQLEGQPVDARSDIFSFGAAVYEMVTGRRAFDGASQAGIIGAILERDPPPMPTLVPLTPPALDRVVRKCLAKDRERRWQTAADLCDELAWITQSSGVTVPHVPLKHDRRGPPQAALGVAAVALAALLGAAWWMTRDDAGAAVTIGTRRLTIGLPNGLYLSRGGIAISPDGASIVFVGSDAPESNTGLGRRGAWRLYQRRFDSTEVIPIAGAEGARGPFFSPDGTSVGYFTSGAVIGPEFSPDGQWLAYVSDEVGSRDVYVVPYPGPGAKRKISASGGVAPAWSRDGTRLYFQSGDAMMVAFVGGESFSPPRRLFSGSFVVDSREDAPREYDVAPDGRFLMFVREWTAADPPELRVISGWR